MKESPGVVGVLYLNTAHAGWIWGFLCLFIIRLERFQKIPLLCEDEPPGKPRPGMSLTLSAGTRCLSQLL